MNTSTRKIVVSERASFTELLENQEGVLLDLESLHYYTLNTTGLYLWKELIKGEVTAETLASEFARNFGLEKDQADADTRLFLTQLEQYKLISFSQEQSVSVAGSFRRFASTLALRYEVPSLRLSSSLEQVALASGSSTAGGSAVGT